MTCCPLCHDGLRSNESLRASASQPGYSIVQHGVFSLWSMLLFQLQELAGMP